MRVSTKGLPYQVVQLNMLATRMRDTAASDYMTKPEKLAELDTITVKLMEAVVANLNYYRQVVEKQTN